MKKLLTVLFFAILLALALGMTQFARHRSQVSKAQSRAYRECGEFLGGDNRYQILNIKRFSDHIDFELAQGNTVVNHSVWSTNRFFEKWLTFTHKDNLVLTYSDELVDSNHPYDPEAYEFPEKEIK